MAIDLGSIHGGDKCSFRLVVGHSALAGFEPFAGDLKNFGRGGCGILRGDHGAAGEGEGNSQQDGADSAHVVPPWPPQRHGPSFDWVPERWGKCVCAETRAW